MIGLPGHSYRGPLPPLSGAERELQRALVGHVHVLADDIGERHMGRPSAFARAAQYIEQELANVGYAPSAHTFAAGNLEARNIEAERVGTSSRVLVIGAHYDSVPGCPGANDNASGVAAMLELARMAANARGRHALRFVAFANEEPPYFMTDAMGSAAYARRCRTRGDDIAGMFSLETIGCYSSQAGSQQYPGPIFLRSFYPDTGNFIGFVSNTRSRTLLRRAGRAFRRTTQFPSEGLAAPAVIPGIAWSDHWAFWQEGYPAVMITDTAPYRYPHYHLSSDTPDKLDYESLARVVMGLSRMLTTLAA